ncbi:MAG: DUF4336 domain-containing protein [Myxococcota bacterium]
MKVYHPINTLKPVVDRLWIIDGPVIRMAFLWGSLPFSTRAVVVQLPSGGLWVHSPTPMLPEPLKRAIDALGPLEHLVSPNALHYAGIPVWKEAWPDALAWSSPGVERRARSQGVEVSFDRTLQDEPPTEWSGTIDQLMFRGSRVLEEVVFFHRPSRTLLLTDLIVNFERDKVEGRWLWKLLRLAGVTDPDGTTPLELRTTVLGRRSMARACFERMRAWNPERVILAHGRWYAERGTEELDRAFRWLR